MMSKQPYGKVVPDYDLGIDRLHLYYNIQLVTCGIDKNRNLIVQFPVCIQPYTQQPLILYEIETVPVPIIDQNTQAQSYTHLQVNKPYIALNSEGCTGGSYLSQNFWEHENLSGLSIIWLIQLFIVILRN